MCSFERQQNKALKGLLTAFAAPHPKKVTLPFPKSGFNVELDHARRWVNIPGRPTENSSVSKFYSLHLVNQFTGVKQAEPAAHAGEADRPL